MNYRKNEVDEIYEDVVSLFSKNAQNTLLFENRGKHLYEIRQIIKRSTASARILDFGGGPGFNLLVLSRLNSKYELFLIDRFEEYAEENRMGSAQSALSLLKESGISVINQDFWTNPRLPYEDKSFDLITCFDVVEHLPGHPMKQFEEVYRILKENGIFILSGPNAISSMKRIKLLFGKHPYIKFDLWCQDNYFGHYREYTASEYRSLLKMAGFGDLQIELQPEPSKTRAKYNFWRTKQIGYSPKSVFIRLALKANYLIEAIFPVLQPAVYCFGKRHPDRKEKSHPPV